MAVMMDIVGSLVLLGMVILMVMGININMSQETYKGLTEYNLHAQSIQLSRIFEFDLYKMGYAVSKPGVIAVAETSKIKFYSNLFNIAGRRDSIEYDLGTTVPSSTNPRDKSLYRFENTTQVFINFSVTRFKLSYYNGNDSLLGTPVTGTLRDSIKSVRVYLTLESPEPFDTSRTGGPSYISTFYQKLIYPRNL
ncbi:MAG: hypothetical protein AUI33_06835 [Ignavibacteria bacterium 13_1_40CM_2_61_4]|nr:MAG: hypothetical protein AUI33_06835 [Ignavibacteria bacterium 13_1_40CM_2_61_4]